MDPLIDAVVSALGADRDEASAKDVSGIGFSATTSPLNLHFDARSAIDLSTFGLRVRERRLSNKDETFFSSRW